MKISYFFDISLNIGRSDMKQKAKNSVRSMLSYPFTFVGILAHTFFLVLPFCLTIGLDYSSIRSDPPIHQGPYTKVHTPSYFRGFKCPYTCLFLYRKKLQMSTFFWYTYIRKNPFELSNIRGPYTSIHQIRTPKLLKLCASNSVLNSVLKFCATCAILLIIKLSCVLALYYLSIFHVLAAIISLCTA